MSLVVAPLTNYPTLQDAANLVRTLVNDDGKGRTGTVGEGQIVVNDASISLKLLNSLNSALSEVYQEMGNAGDPTLIADNYILKGLPPVHGVNGVASPDPAVQVSLGYAGFFDGTLWWPQFKLPANMLEPARIWQRTTSSNLPFYPMTCAPSGLEPTWQGVTLGEWEWRQDGLWFNGATQNCDIRIRSRIKLPLFFGANLDYTTTYIPLQNCVNAVAYKTAAKIDASLGNAESAAEFKADAKGYMYLLKNERARQRQGTPYHRPGYQEGQSNGLGLGLGW